MSTIFFDESDKPIIVKHIKDWVKVNGYVSTRYACLDAVKTPEGLNKDWNLTEYEIQREAFISSVSSMLVNTGEYVREKNSLGYDYDILLNPAFFLNKSVTKTSKTTMRLALLAVIISLAALLKDFLTSNTIKFEEIQITNKDLQHISQNLDLVTKSIQEINFSLNKIYSDTAILKGNK